MKLNKSTIQLFGVLFCFLLTALEGNTVANGESGSYELIYFIKKDMQFSGRESSWGGVARMTGRCVFNDKNEIAITLDKSNIVTTYEQGMKEGPETPVHAKVADIGSSNYVEGGRISEVVRSGDRGLVVMTLPLLNAIILDRKVRQSSVYEKTDGVEPMVFRSVLKGSELLVARHKHELRVIDVPGGGQKIPDVALTWLLSDSLDLSSKALVEAFDNSTPSFEISFGIISMVE